VNTAKIEAGPSLFYAPTFLYDREALGECEALKTLSTELYIIEDLTVRWLLKEGRGEGPHTSFDISTDISRAIGLSSPKSGHSKRARSGKMQH
jgi:hypothetical protein